MCSFARLTFGLVEAADRTNGQFQQFNSSLNQTKYQPNQIWQKNTLTGGPSGRQPGAIFQLQGRERRTPSDGAPIYQGSFEEYHIPAT